MRGGGVRGVARGLGGGRWGSILVCNVQMTAALATCRRQQIQLRFSTLNYFVLIYGLCINVASARLGGLTGMTGLWITVFMYGILIRETCVSSLLFQCV